MENICSLTLASTQKQAAKKLENAAEKQGRGWFVQTVPCLWLDFAMLSIYNLIRRKIYRGECGE